MRLLLISTYELGRQPIHLASPAASLRAAGHIVSTIDLSVQPFVEENLEGIDAVAISVPMHTAMRLAVTVAERIKAINEEVPVALYGLYAGVGRDHTLGRRLADRLIGGEYEPALLEWAGNLGKTTGLTIETPAAGFQRPDRSSLPPVGEYARLEWGGESRLAAAVEASHGCRHRCRHCPVPVIYDGRLRVVGAEPVLADIDQLAAAGVRHISFGDPDFLNAPRYSTDIVAEAHRRHPELTFDATVKVSHIIQHRKLWSDLSDRGLLFVVSAFESVDEMTLEILEKGHSLDDMRLATKILEESGVHMRPTWLPFFPWTQLDDLVRLVGFLDEMLLWEATDPVQLSIKLLIPEGSLLERSPAVVPHLTNYDSSAFTWSWVFESEVVAQIHKELDALAASGSDCGAETSSTLRLMRDAIGSAAQVDLGELPIGVPRPRLTESWFCCAEPTHGQLVSLGDSLSILPTRSS